MAAGGTARDGVRRVAAERGDGAALRSPFRTHVALPGDHGAWAFLLGPLVIGLCAGGRLGVASLWLGAAVLAAFLIRQPIGLAVKIASGRRGRQDLAAARFWIVAYGALGLAALAALVARGFGYLVVLGLPALPIFFWFLVLVARRSERRQVLLEVLATATLALAAPAAMWVGLGRPDPRGWLLWALVAAPSATSILFAHLRLAQRGWPERGAWPARLRAGAPVLALSAVAVAAVAALAAGGRVPSALVAPYLFRLAEAIEGTLRPAVGWKPRRIGFRLLWGTLGFTALFVWAWR
jgi:hypothetical protein